MNTNVMLLSPFYGIVAFVSPPLYGTIMHITTIKFEGVKHFKIFLDVAMIIKIDF